MIAYGGDGATLRLKPPQLTHYLFNASLKECYSVLVIQASTNPNAAPIKGQRNIDRTSDIIAAPKQLSPMQGSSLVHNPKITVSKMSAYQNEALR